MRVLVTGGVATVPIDGVHGIVNMVDDGEGAAVATHMRGRGHHVTFLTSGQQNYPFSTLSFQTREGLMNVMRKEIESKAYDVVVHAATVADFQVADIKVTSEEDYSGLVEISPAGDLFYDFDRIQVRFNKCSSVIPYIRNHWGFAGKLVCFERFAGLFDSEVVEAVKNKMKSYRGKADLVVGISGYVDGQGEAKESVLLFDADCNCEEIKRHEIPGRVAKRLGLSGGATLLAS